MNYRHAFHAGNFADVVKHAVLSLLIGRLKAKETAFRIIDTHAGRGTYDLAASEAERTGEWRLGIGRLFDATLPAELAELLQPYLDVVHAANGDGRLRYYPGSPAIARALLRRQDRLTAVELHPQDAAFLGAHFAGDFQVRVVALDGWLALGAFVPPKERRGLVLVDPPYEAEDEFGRLCEAFLKAHRRWPSGVYVLWYPIKDIAAAETLRARLRESRTPRLLGAELRIRDPLASRLFSGSGLIIANPPWRLEEDLRRLLAGLAPILADGPGAAARVELIAGE